MSSQSHLHLPKYRRDIDGLRAVAVLAVVAYHAFPVSLRGGFVGVDIFFVISGFLISTIIFENLENNTFSFLEFYARRIRRIFPALILVLASCLAFGWFVLLADEYRQLGKHIFASSAFIQNIILWREAGYFDNTAETKPLLHLWSLAVEEQFYIVFPFLLWASWKKKFNLLTLTIIVGAISLYLNLAGIQKDAVATFYSPQTRFWELLSGSILGWLLLYKRNRIEPIFSKANYWLNTIFYRSGFSNPNILANCISLFGLSLIIWSATQIEGTWAFPGGWAIIPVLGAVFIIAAGHQAWVNRYILSNRIAVGIGLISYPLYLWHWSLLSFVRIIEGKTPHRDVRITMVAASIILATLTYLLIERPIRFGKYKAIKVVILVILTAAIGLTGIIIHHADGVKERAVVQLNWNLDSGKDGWDNGHSISECGISVEQKSLFASCFSDRRPNVKYALFGDSKAGALFGGLVRTSSENHRWLFIGGGLKHADNSYTSPVVISKYDVFKSHQPFTEIALSSFSNNINIEKVVMVVATRNLFKLNNDYSIEDLPQSSNYDAALDGVMNNIEYLRRYGKKLVIVTDNPTLSYPVDCQDRKTNFSFLNSFLKNKNGKLNCEISLNRHIELTAQYRKLLETIESRYPNDVRIFDTTKFLCDLNDGVCRMHKNGRALYSITDHISDYAAGIIGFELNKFLQTF